MKINILSTLSLFMLLFSSCEQVIDIKLPPHEPHLVVYANIDEGDTEIIAWVGYTVGILDTADLGNWHWFEEDSLNYSESAWVPNASIRIYENDLLLAELQPVPHLRIYRASLSAPLQSAGKTYEMEVSAPDYPTVTAKMVFPREPQIGNIVYEALGGRDEYGYEMDRVSFDVLDPAGSGDIYDFSATVGRYDSFENRRYEQLAHISSNDPLLEKAYPSVLFSDAGNDGQTYPIQLILYPIDTSNGGFGRLKVSCITKTEYFFHKSYNEYVNAVNNPFAEPVVLYTNIENGRGLFIGRQTKIFNIVN